MRSPWTPTITSQERPVSQLLHRDQPLDARKVREAKISDRLIPKEIKRFISIVFSCDSVAGSRAVRGAGAPRIKTIPAPSFSRRVAAR